MIVPVSVMWPAEMKWAKRRKLRRIRMSQRKIRRREQIIKRCWGYYHQKDFKNNKWVKGRLNKWNLQCCSRCHHYASNPYNRRKVNREVE